jgi:hypothetical protein
MINDIKSVLRFSAFRPEPDDSASSWRQRFGHQRTAMVSMGRNTVSFCSLDRHGVVTEGSSAQGEPKEVLAELGPLILENTDDGWCSLVLNTRYVISVEHNLPRKQGSEEAIKSDPRSVLHARYERGKRYAVTHNPETNSSLLVAYEEENIRKVEGLFKEQDLKIGRLCCGAYVLLRYALAETNKTKGNENPLSALYIACCAGSVCALVQEKDNWQELRSRPDVYTAEDMQPLFDLVSPFQSRLSPGAGVVLVADEPIEGLSAKLGEIFPDRPLNDLSREHLLAELVFRN